MLAVNSFWRYCWVDEIQDFIVEVVRAGYLSVNANKKEAAHNVQPLRFTKNYIKIN